MPEQCHGPEHVVLSLRTGALQPLVDLPPMNLATQGYNAPRVVIQRSGE
jgi:hypothetical protein